MSAHDEGLHTFGDDDEPSKGSAKDRIQSRTAYAWLWLWTLVVLSGSIWLYTEASEFCAQLVYTMFPKVEPVLANSSELVQFIAQWGVCTLFCWRAVKVLALHSSPFLWPGISRIDTVDEVEMKITKSRKTHLYCIGCPMTDADRIHTYLGEFLYGAIFTSHPTSDKLMRTRLHLLVVSLPFNCSLIVEDSHLKFRRDLLDGNSSASGRRAAVFQKYHEKYINDGDRKKRDQRNVGIET